jgi:hypothetical protein
MEMNCKTAIGEDLIWAAMLAIGNVQRRPLHARDYKLNAEINS